MRIGHGYDAHRLGENRALIIGNVTVPYEMGLIAHSDGDVLIHAIIDALLGAAGLPDIGAQFPDNDNTYLNIDSGILLHKTADLLREHGFGIEYVDATVIAQAPKLKPYLPEIKARLCALLNLPDGTVNVKATTEEKMGFTGNKEGIAAHAVCLLHSL